MERYSCYCAALHGVPRPMPNETAILQFPCGWLLTIEIRPL
jgi:hypothetical protein